MPSGARRIERGSPPISAGSIAGRLYWVKVEVTGSNLPKLFFSTLVNQIVPSRSLATLSTPVPVLEPEHGGVGAQGFT